MKPTLHVSCEDGAVVIDCTDAAISASGALNAVRAVKKFWFGCKAVIEIGGFSLPELMIELTGQATVEVVELDIGCQSSSMYGEGLISDAAASLKSSSSAFKGSRQVLAFSRYLISFAFIASRPLIQILIPPSFCPGVLSQTSWRIVVQFPGAKVQLPRPIERPYSESHTD